MNSYRRAWRVGGQAVAVAALLLTGCTSYYKVTDPTSNKVYYTTSNVSERYKSTGAVTFTDSTTGSQVTLQSSEVKKLTKEEYESATAKPAK